MSESARLPTHWLCVPLSDLLLGIETGKSFKCEERPPNQHEIGVVKVSAVSWGDYKEGESKTCLDPARVNEASVIRAGDFLFSRANTQELVGACVIAARVSLRVMLSDKILRFRFAKEALKPWVVHFLRSRDGRAQIERLSTGNQESMRNIGQERVGQIRVPVPPLHEQSRIVAKLEELLSDLDAGVAELKAAQKKLAQYRQSLLKAAVEGRLTDEWRAQRPPSETGAQLLERILTERRARWEARQLAKFKEQGKTPPKDWQKKYPEPALPDISALPELPEGWVWASIDQLAYIGTGVTPLRSRRQYFEGGNIPWVTSGALNDEVVTQASEMVTVKALDECRLELYPVGTLLVAMYGEGRTRGKCSELAIPATINQAIAALVLEGAAQECKPYLKSFLLKSYDDMRNQALGGVQPNLNLHIIRSIAVPLPPVSEQMALGSHLAAQLETVQTQYAAIELCLRQSTAQRQNILRAAFSGQLVPQDPKDEPASVLLERIRAERAAQAAVKKPRRKVREPA